MPHLTIDYSPTLDRKAPMWPPCAGDCIRVAIANIRRLPRRGASAFGRIGLTHAIVADGHPDNDFVAMTLSVGAGRTTAELKAAGDALFEAARDAVERPAR